MASAILAEVIERAAAWPPEDQAKLVAAAQLIEAQQVVGFELSDEDWRIIDQRVRATNDVVPEPEVKAFFRKYGNT